MRVQRRQGFNPLLGLRDYSGYERAAEIERASMEQLGQNIGSAIKGYKEKKDNEKFRRGFAEELIADANRTNADGTTDPSAARKLAFFNVNKGDFGDQNAEQQVETLYEALAGYDKERLQTLRDGFSLQELEHKQKLEQIQLEETAFLDAAKFTGNGSEIPKYTSTPNEAELERLHNTGVKTIIVNGKKMEIEAPEEEEEEKPVVTDPLLNNRQNAARNRVQGIKDAFGNIFQGRDGRSR